MSEQRTLATHGHNQFVGRTLNVNGPVKQDIYNTNPFVAFTYIYYLDYTLL